MYWKYQWMCTLLHAVSYVIHWYVLAVTQVNFVNTGDNEGLHLTIYDNSVKWIFTMSG